LSRYQAQLEAEFLNKHYPVELESQAT